MNSQKFQHTQYLLCNSRVKMSYFDIEEVKSGLSGYLGSDYLIKPKDERWKNFKPWFMPLPAPDVLAKTKELEVFEDDVFLTGYLRSGTTMLAEMLWLMLNNFDFEKANSLITDDRVPGLE